MNPRKVAKKLLKKSVQKREINIPYTLELVSHFYNIIPNIGDNIINFIIKKR